MVEYNQQFAGYFRYFVRNTGRETNNSASYYSFRSAEPDLVKESTEVRIIKESGRLQMVNSVMAGIKI